MLSGEIYAFFVVGLYTIHVRKHNVGQQSITLNNTRLLYLI